MNESVVCQDIRLDDLGVVEVNVVALEADTDCGSVERSNSHSIFQVVGVCDLVQCMSTKSELSVTMDLMPLCSVDKKLTTMSRIIHSGS